MRYGVAPDHFSIRSVRDTLAKVLEKPGVRCWPASMSATSTPARRLGQRAELPRAATAGCATYGAGRRDRRLDVPGEDLPGSIAATDFVAWYCGHPDVDREAMESVLAAARSVVVVGVGNVAVDVTRVLTAPMERLEATDMPQHVLDALRASTVSDVPCWAAGGPAQATWTTKELASWVSSTRWTSSSTTRTTSTSSR